MSILKQQAILYGIIGLLVGSLVTVFISQFAISTNNQGLMSMMGLSRMNGGSTYTLDQQGMPDNGQIGMGTSMRGMMVSMEGKTGMNFDKAFLESMIVHHEGAIEMAREAKEKGQHPQVKQMSEDIITAQTKEIDQMKTWISEWGL